MPALTSSAAVEIAERAKGSSEKKPTIRISDPEPVEHVVTVTRDRCGKANLRSLRSKPSGGAVRLAYVCVEGRHRAGTARTPRKPVRFSDVPASGTRYVDAEGWLHEEVRT